MFLVACFLMSFVLGIPFLFKFNSKFDSAVSCLYFALKVMVGGGDSEIFYTIANQLSTNVIGSDYDKWHNLLYFYSIIYRSVLFALFISSPFVTTAILAKMMGFSFSSVRYYFAWIGKKKINIFSELNSRSLTLAADIYRKNKSVIVFCNTDENTLSGEDYTKCKEIKAIVLPNSVIRLYISKNIYKKRVKKFGFI
jgi:hypothetical protein